MGPVAGRNRWPDSKCHLSWPKRQAEPLHLLRVIPVTCRVLQSRHFIGICLQIFCHSNILYNSGVLLVGHLLAWTWPFRIGIPNWCSTWHNFWHSLAYRREIWERHHSWISIVCVLCFPTGRTAPKWSQSLAKDLLMSCCGPLGEGFVSKKSPIS